MNLFNFFKKKILPNSIRISVADDFTRFPSGRIDGPYCGERFRKDHIVPLLKSTNKFIEIDLDGTLGFSNVFLDEAFGGLIKKENFDLKDLQGRLFIKSKIECYVNVVWDAILEAHEEKQNRKVMILYVPVYEDDVDIVEKIRAWIPQDAKHGKMEIERILSEALEEILKLRKLVNVDKWKI